MISSLQELAGEQVWLAWRNDVVGGRTTKVPYSPHGGKGDTSDPNTWGLRAAAEQRATQIVNGLGGGIGVVLGINVGGGLRLGGVDLDSCLSSPEEIEEWAIEVIVRFASFTEISPSGTGAKIYFLYRDGDLDRIRDMMTGERKSGRKFARLSSGDHPPAIEVYISNRYFAVTGDVLDDALTALRIVEIDDLIWLLQEFGPAFSAAGKPNSAGGAGPRDQSRSAAAFRIGLRMHQAGASYDEFREAVRDDPETAEWYAEKGAANDERELHRIWEKAEAAQHGSGGLPQIQVKSGERHEAANAGIAALIEAGTPIYRRGAQLMYVVRLPAKSAGGDTILTPGTMPVPMPLLMRELGMAAIWVQYDGRSKKLVRIDPPAGVASQILSMADEWPFEPLLGVIGTQTMRPDGTILEQAGYDEATGLVLFEPPTMLPVPERPSQADAERALKLLNELITEFPFAGDKPKASRSVALSMLMTPVLRGAIGPAVPLHVVKAPAGGTGKSYLADLASAISSGEVCPVLSRAPRDEETEKRLHGAALSGQPIISVDNCNGPLASQFLCQAIERPLLQIRALGGSDLTRIGNNTTCFANGNNIEIAEDLVRRTLQCELDADMERPETRRFTKNPLKAILANRGKYVAAVLTIARAYVVAGMPEKSAPFMSFDRWSDLVRGSLMWLGCADPVETVETISVADPVRENRVAVYQAIAALPNADAGFKTAELIKKADDNEGLEAALLAVARSEGGGISAERLGKWLRRSVNVMAGGYKLFRDASDKQRPRWIVRKV